jgi:osmotically-inducible protein OsmY
VAPPVPSGPAAGNVVVDPSGALRPATPSVTGTPSPFDQALTQRLRSALVVGQTQLGGISQENLNSLNIISENGVVTLRGTVANARERQMVESQLRRVVGVRSLNNQIQIAGSETIPTTQTTAPIQNSVPQLAR